MVETITPVVHGGRTRWVRAVALHVAGAGLAAASFGAGLGALGSLLGAPWGRAGALAVALLAGLYAVGEIDRISVAVPQLRRQVPDWWRTYFGPTFAAFLYGAGLGVGFLTFLTHGTLVVVAGAAIAMGGPIAGAMIVGTFGIVRAVAVVTARAIRSEEDGPALVDRLVSRDDRRRRIANGAALATVVALGLAATATSRGGWALTTGAVVAGAFGWSAAAKLAAPRRWRRALADHRLPLPVARLVAPAVPIVEMFVPALALLGLRRASAGLAIGLLGAFSLEVVRARLAVGAGVRCGCFGERTARPASLVLARNVALAVLAGLALAAADAPRITWPAAPAGSDLLPAALASIGLVVAAWAAWRSAAWLRRGTSWASNSTP